jgi:murein DD-endopeptidase MepM/ murein hydrolase activator NlpD
MQRRSPFLILGRKEGRKAPKSSRRLSPILRAVAWCAVFVFWYRSEDWRIKYPSLIRAAAHVSVIALALVAIFFGGMEISEPPAYASADGLPNADIVFGATSPPAEMHLESTSLPAPDGCCLPSNVHAVSRLPVPHTLVPERPRAQVITHVVQRGDTLFDIAARFGISPTTIVWSNREALQGVPWLVRAGTELFILPVDGVYHTARRGETAASIAADYGIDAADLYNEWNDLGKGQHPHVEQQLVVPGGKGEELGWQPLLRYAAPGPAMHSYGVFDDEGSADLAAGPVGHGWFTYPTGGSDVSGWYFHDRRLRTHIGIDYRCRKGDPIYAADSGVVTIARWYGTYGITVEIDHGNGFVTRYGHFSSVAVERGQPVYQGDLIGVCGSTGWSSGPHLHFEVRQDGLPQDPEIYLPPLDPVNLMAKSRP